MVTIECPQGERAYRRLGTVARLETVAVIAVGHKTALCQSEGHLHRICIGKILIYRTQHHRSEVGIPTKERETTEIATAEPFGTPYSAYRRYDTPDRRIVYVIPTQGSGHCIVAVVMFAVYPSAFR